MSQFNSFEQTPRCDLIEHLAQIDALYQNKLDELRALGAVKDTLLSVIGVHALQGASIELSPTPNYRINDVA